MKQWKSYVGFESWDHYSAGEESANPGPIDNKPILKEGSNTVLREHLIDDLDYFLLPEEGWNKLLSWYGITQDQEGIKRKVIEEGIYSKSLKVEVYPWNLKISENTKPDEQIVKEFSRADTIEELEKAMRQAFNIAEEKEVRLWNRYMTNMYEQLNKKENTLQDAGLYSGQIVVLEQKNEDGTWPRQTQTSKPSTSTAASGSSFSTRSGASYGTGGSYGTYYNGYDGGQSSTTPGLCGLSNIGNTCFMNSALQCMSNVHKLTMYMQDNTWKEDLNEDNPLGMNGEIATSYAELVHVMWSGRYSYTVPRNFKYAVGRFAPQFSGYQQQDSQELMAFLLDGLHEDLNRIRKKPYVELKDAGNRPDKVVAKEAWDNYKLRNDSVIVDLFHGLLKSTVQCPECSKISVTFDPFCYLSLPLPVKKERQLEIFWVPLDPSKKPVQFKLTVPKTGGVADLCEVLSQYVDVKQEFMVVTDVYNHRFHKVFSPSEALSHIMDRDDIFVYEVPISSADDQNLIVVPIYLREERMKSSTYNQSYMGTYQLFGQPLLLPVPRQNCSYDQLYNLVLQRLSRLVEVPAESNHWWVQEEMKDSDNYSDTDDNGSAVKRDNEQNGVQQSDEDQGMEISNGEETGSDITPDEEKSSAKSSAKSSDMNGEDEENSSEEVKAPRLFRFTAVNSYGSAELDNKFKDDGKPLKLNGRMYVAVDWNGLAKDKFYKDEEAEAFEIHETMKAKPQKKQVIQLTDCLDLFTTTEKLGAKDPWYCPRCEKHQQATKKFDLWSLPDTLIIHLKRFSYNRYFRDKIDTLVEFPTKHLDLEKLVINPEAGPMVYDLIAVSNHYGGLGGGHYTAYCKNYEKNAWYYFDDSSVSESDEESTVTKAAYVLVYQKKGTDRRVTRKSESTATATASEDIETSINGFKTDEDMETN